ncbi:MAG: 50S ribosomal protein L1 [Opitutales bacterium]|nr:50S ribosomal protein L1 [Opitutales bacterium]
MMKSKRYRSAQEKVEAGKSYDLQQAFTTLFSFPAAKFDETAELALHLAVDPMQSDQMVRGIVQLPHGNGKKVRIIAFTKDAPAALQAGACEAGMADLIEKIKGGWLDFDIAVATTEAMKEVKSLARILGPKGLMPNPKAGTVTDDLVPCIEALKKGRVEFKMDKDANVHLGIGKRSFGLEALIENVQAALEAIRHARPSVFRGKLVLNGAISFTMSPSVLLEPSIFAKF